MSGWTLTFKPPGSDKEQSLQLESENITGRSAKLEHTWELREPHTITLVNPRTKINYAGGRNQRYGFDFDEDHASGLPDGWDYASNSRSRKIIPGELVKLWFPPKYESHTVEGSDTLYTGSIGHIVGMTLHTDIFIRLPEKRKSKFVYALTEGKDNKGHHIVQAYLWERDNPGRTYWYKFRSARLAHKHLKMYDAAKRTWSDMENE